MTGQASSKSLGMTREFLLHAGLKITASEPAVSEVALGDAARFFGINASTSAVPLKRYRVTVPAAGGTVRLQYEGRFDFGLSDQKEEYTRGFRETVGIVSKEGVYLAGNGFWYPHLGRGLVEYDVEVAEPEGWHVISAGNGTSRDTKGAARWESHGAIDEITLVGGPLLVYRDSAGAVETLVYLRQKDDALAGKYLQATAQYVEMYRGLVGPYPYGKFALVENFWETGYGMPSYTLLGSQIIRFPFIISSSYPHEILHNWWGNSVFVDYETGNWCEGLTAYLADHLIQEQRGRGEEYRRDTLQKYRSYVRDGRDFPLTRVPLAPQRGDRGGGLREDAHGLPHDPAAHRGRGLPQVGGPLLPRVPREAGLVRRRAEVAGGGGGAGPRPFLRRPRREAGRGRAAGDGRPRHPEGLRAGGCRGIRSSGGPLVARLERSSSG